MSKFQLLTPRTYLRGNATIKYCANDSSCAMPQRVLCLRLDVVLCHVTSPGVLALAQNAHTIAQRRYAFQQRLDEKFLARSRQVSANHWHLALMAAHRLLCHLFEEPML